MSRDNGGMTMATSPVLITLTDQDRAELGALARARKAPLRSIQRAWIVLAHDDDGVLQAYRVDMVKRVARDPAAGVLLALSAMFMLTGAVLVVLVSRAGWGLLAVGVLLSGAAVVKVLLRRPGKSTCTDRHLPGSGRQACRSTSWGSRNPSWFGWSLTGRGPAPTGGTGVRCVGGVASRWPSTARRQRTGTRQGAHAASTGQVRRHP